MGSVERAHHDGSVLYVDNQAPALGDEVNLWARAPADAGVEAVYLRLVEDGEVRFVEAALDRASAAERWWRAEVKLRDQVTQYRFFLRLANGGYRWLNGSGVHPYEVTDAEDFRLLTFFPPPTWAQSAVVYEIFIDRFACSGAPRPAPPWAVPCDWGTPVAHRGRLASSQLYGGDLAGIEAHLGHVQDLGANVIYLTPFFPSQSNHHYDAESFDHVDALLGGDEALAALARAAHARGLRVLGDLTTNHTGDSHEWFRLARTNLEAPEHGFYYWQDNPPGYACWNGHPRLPKLNYGGRALWARLVDGPGSVAAHWLQPPYELDGWRIDVANMTGRHGLDDFNAEVARAMRSTMAAVRPDSLLIAEHSHDYAPDLGGDGWHGAMNYSGFTKPVWTWLAQEGTTVQFLGQPLPVPRTPGRLVSETMVHFLAHVPWRVATHHFNLLGSHDTPRFLTVTGDSATARVGAALLFSFPGIPMVFSGDEIGLEGMNGEASRRPFPWDDAQSWDLTTLASFRELATLRKSSPALTTGGMRWAYRSDDALAFLREAPGERVLVLLTRAAGSGIVLDADAVGWSGEAANCYGGALLEARDGKLVLPGDGPMAQLWWLS